MTQKTFTVLSEYDGLPLAGLIVEPSCAPKGVVQLNHGMAERKERYLPFMEYLARHGYVAACHDHRGHGQSMEKHPDDQGWFGDYTAKAVVEDALLVNAYLKERYPDLPLTLFGHSMGSMIVRCMIQLDDGACDKLIVCGSPSKNPLAGMGIFVEKCIRLFKGARHKSKTLKNLSTGAYSKRFKGEGSGAWLSKNRENVEGYIADPNCGFLFTCNGYENLFKLLKRTYQKGKYEVNNSELPILFVAGAEDPVIVSEKKWQSSIDFLRKRGYLRCKGKLYQEMRHEILNEEGRAEVYSDLLEFIDA